MSTKKRCDAEFKREIAKIYPDGRRTAPSLASELCLHENTIYKWAELVLRRQSFETVKT